MPFTNTTSSQDRTIDEAPGHSASLVEIIEDLDTQLTEAKRELRSITEERDDLLVQLDDLKGA